MTQFHGGEVPADREVWTATVGAESVGYEEIDVMVPVYSDDTTIRSAVQRVLDEWYPAGLPIVDVSPFRGVTIWNAR